MEIKDIDRMLDDILKTRMEVHKRIQEKNNWQAKTQEVAGNGDFWLDMEDYLAELHDTEKALKILKDRIDSMEGY
jgi:hypothetical protein